jgi:hypothetical protein
MLSSAEIPELLFDRFVEELPGSKAWAFPLSLGGRY